MLGNGQDNLINTSESTSSSLRKDIFKEKYSIDYEYGVFNMIDLMTVTESSKITHIELVDCQLCTVPQELWEMINIRSLSLACNVIKNIDEWLFLRMREMREFNISDNILKSLPASLAQAENLLSLDISKNRLRHIPSHLCSLHLTQLNICSNDLRTLPSSFIHLQFLNYLTLDWFRYVTPPLSPMQGRDVIHVLFAAIQADTELQLKKEQQQALLKEKAVSSQNNSVDAKNSLKQIPKSLERQHRTDVFSPRDIKPNNLKRIDNVINLIHLDEESLNAKTCYEGGQNEIQSIWDEQEGGQINEYSDNIMSRCYQDSSLAQEFSFAKFLRVFEVISPYSQENTKFCTMAHEAVRNQDFGALASMVCSEELGGIATLRDGLDEDGHSPLSLAIELENYFCVKILIDIGADVSIGPIPPLIQAVRYLQFYLVNDLLEHGASVAQTDQDGNTCLHALFSIFQGNEAYKIAELLLLHGADPNRLNNAKYAPVHIAAIRGNSAAIRFILGYNQRISQNQPEKVEMLVLKPFVNQSFKIGIRGGVERNNILHIASEKSYTEIIEQVLQYNTQSKNQINFLARNTLNWTPFALGQRHSTISKLLKRSESIMISIFTSSIPIQHQYLVNEFQIVKDLPPFRKNKSAQSYVNSRFPSLQVLPSTSLVNFSRPDLFSHQSSLPTEEASSVSFSIPRQKASSALPIDQKSLRIIPAFVNQQHPETLNTAQRGMLIPSSANILSPLDTFSSTERSQTEQQFLTPISAQDNDSQNRFANDFSKAIEQSKSPNETKNQILQKMASSSTQSQPIAADYSPIQYADTSRNANNIQPMDEIQLTSNQNIHQELFCDYDGSSSDEDEQLKEHLSRESSQNLSNVSFPRNDSLSPYHTLTLASHHSLPQTITEFKDLDQDTKIKRIEEEASVSCACAQGVANQSFPLTDRIENLLRLYKAHLILTSITAPSRSNSEDILKNATENLKKSSNNSKNLDGNLSHYRKSTNSDFETEKSSFSEILHDAKTQCAEAITKVNDALFQERDALKASRKFSILETQNSKEWRPIKDNIAAGRYVSIMRRYNNEALQVLFARLFPQQLLKQWQQQWKTRKQLIFQQSSQQNHKTLQSVMSQSQRNQLNQQKQRQGDLEADMNMQQNMLAYFEAAQNSKLQQLMKPLKANSYQDTLFTQALPTEDEYDFKQIEQPAAKVSQYPSHKPKGSFIPQRFPFKI